MGDIHQTSGVWENIECGAQKWILCNAKEATPRMTLRDTLFPPSWNELRQKRERMKTQENLERDQKRIETQFAKLKKKLERVRKRRKSLRRKRRKSKKRKRRRSKKKKRRRSKKRKTKKIKEKKTKKIKE